MYVGVDCCKPTRRQAEKVDNTPLVFRIDDNHAHA